MTAATELKNQYKNVTSGWLGVTIKDAKGDFKGIAVPPQGEIWLDEDERAATAQAPRLPANNPFVNDAEGRPRLVKIAEGGEAKTNRAIDAPRIEDIEQPAAEPPPPPGPGMPVEERQPDPASTEPQAPAPGEEATSTPQPAPPPPSSPPTGWRDKAEEVATPDAEEKAKEAAAEARVERPANVRTGPPGGEQPPAHQRASIRETAEGGG